MKRYKISFEVVTPDHINENMVSSKFDNVETELNEYLQCELGEDDEIFVQHFSCWTK